MFVPYEKAEPLSAPAMPWQRLLALPIFACAAAAALTFPVIPYWLLAALSVYSVALALRPALWLAVLPVCLPLVELAPWSGRLLFDGFDMFAVATVAAACWHGYYRLENVSVRSRVAAALLLSLCVAWTVSLIHGAYPLGVPDGNAWSGYYTHFNSLRIFKGFLWAALLAPALGQALRTDPARAQRLLSLGISMGLLGVGIVVLWERGVLGDVLDARGYYRTLADLLNFTTEYRITALFSEMHTGGASIDGYLALTWPFALLPAFLGRHWALKAVGILAFVLGLYAMAVTFSRDVYGAFGVSTVILLAGLVAARPRWLTRRTFLWLPPSLAVAAAIAFYDHRVGGILAVASAMLAFAGTAVASPWPGQTNLAARLAVAAIAVILSFYGVMHGMATSKWVANSHLSTLVTGAITAISAGFCGAMFGTALQGISRVNAWLLTAAVAAAVTAAVSVGTGYRMETRFSTVSKDAQTRLHHWSQVMDAMSPNWSTRFFGMGLGRFPHDFLLQTGNEEHLGTYQFVSGGPAGSYLRLGGGNDTEVGQRITIEPDRLYRVSATVRASDPKAKLNVSVCEKNILFQQAYQPNCIRLPFRATISTGEWQHISAVFNSGRAGIGKWYSRWPVVMLLYNPVLGTTLDVKDLRVVGATTGNAIYNGSFTRGGDRWFAYNDFNHLQWHTKNMWLNVYFEQGLFGALALLGCVLLGLFNGIKRLICGDSYALVALSAICGFLAVGLFGSLFDAPRLTFLLLLVSCTLIMPQAANQTSRAYPFESKKPGRVRDDSPSH